MTKPGAPVVISLNHYMPPVRDKKRRITVENGNGILVGGILRLVSRTDEEWTEKLREYFTPVTPGRGKPGAEMAFCNEKPGLGMRIQ